jgi:hypothetical protein
MCYTYYTPFSESLPTYPLGDRYRFNMLREPTYLNSITRTCGEETENHYRRNECTGQREDFFSNYCHAYLPSRAGDQPSRDRHDAIQTEAKEKFLNMTSAMLNQTYKTYSIAMQYCIREATNVVDLRIKYNKIAQQIQEMSDAREKNNKKSKLSKLVSKIKKKKR